MLLESTISIAFDPVPHQVNKLLHLVLPVLAVVMLKVELLGHQFVDYAHVDHVAEMDPLLPYFLVNTLLL